MQVQIGNERIEASGAYIYIKSFGRVVFITRRAGFPLMQHVRPHAQTGEREIWGDGFLSDH